MKRRYLDGDQVLDKWTELHGEASVVEMYNNCDFLFFQYDKDSDNHLSFDEAESFLTDFSHSSNRSQEDLFRVCDVDADGLLSQHEFRSAYLMYEMLLLDFLRVEEFLELRPQYRKGKGRSRRQDVSSDADSSKPKTSDKWVGRDVEVRWLYNTVRQKYRWESAKVEERNRNGTYRVFFSGDAYPTDDIPEENIREVSQGTLRLILIGPPNSGAEIQAAHLVRKYGVVHLKYEELQEGRTPAARAPDPIYGAKTLEEDKIQALQDTIENSGCTDKGFLITGFPKTAIEARDLDDMLGALRITHVLNIRIPFRIFRERVTPAGERDDKALAKQLQSFENEMTPVLEYYENKSVVRGIHANVIDDDEIWQKVQAALLRNETEEAEWRARKEAEELALSESIEELELHPTFPRLLPLEGEEEPTGVCERTSCVIQ